MNRKAEELQARTHSFFIQVIAFCKSVPDNPAGQSIRNQLLDSAGSADSNYRAACKARSRKDFISKVGVAAEEADESLGWLIALRDAGLGDRDAVTPLITEADELTAIFVKSGKTAKRRLEEENRLRAAARKGRVRR